MKFSDDDSNIYLQVPKIELLEMFQVSVDISNIPSQPGVYLIFDTNKKLIYIGQTKNLNQRIHQHASNHRNYGFSKIPIGETAYASYLLVDEYLLKSTEMLYIDFYHPKYNFNNQKTFFDPTNYITVEIERAFRAKTVI